MDGKKTPAPMPPAVPKTAAVGHGVGASPCARRSRYVRRAQEPPAVLHVRPPRRLLLSCIESVPLTDAQNAELSALWFGMLCCAALQAAAAVLALLLPCRRRRALAHIALAVTMAGHCMYAVAVRLLLAAVPGFLFGKIVGPAIIVFFAGGDLAHLMGLLQPGGGD